MIKVPSTIQRFLIFMVCFSLLNVSAVPPTGAMTLARRNAGAYAHNRATNQLAPANTIQITVQGFAPNVLAVSAPADVTWRNQTGATVILKSGSPVDDGDGNNELFLPLIQNNMKTQAQGVAPDQAMAPAQDFEVTIAAGDSFTYRYTIVGEYAFHLIFAQIERISNR